MKRLNFPVFLALFCVFGPLRPAAAEVVGMGPYVSPIPSKPDAYFHVGPLNLIAPWQEVHAIYAYDFKQDESTVGGEVVVASLWKIQATVGGVTNFDGRGYPFVVGNLFFSNPIPQIAILSEIKPGIFGGWNWRDGSTVYGAKAAVNIF